MSQCVFFISRPVIKEGWPLFSHVVHDTKLYSTLCTIQIYCIYTDLCVEAVYGVYIIIYMCIHITTTGLNAACSGGVMTC